MKPCLTAALLSAFALFLLSPPAWAWFAEGHEIVAMIAAVDLTPTVRSHVAQTLGVSSDTGSMEKAMAAASIRPDTDFRNKDRTTASWHFIDICLQDTEQDVRRGALKVIALQQKSMSTPVAFAIKTTTNGEHPATSPF